MHALSLLEFLNKVKWILQTNTSTKPNVDLRNLFSLPRCDSPYFFKLF